MSSSLQIKRHGKQASAPAISSKPVIYISARKYASGWKDYADPVPDGLPPAFPLDYWALGGARAKLSTTDGTVAGRIATNLKSEQFLTRAAPTAMDRYGGGGAAAAAAAAKAAERATAAAMAAERATVAVAAATVTVSSSVNSTSMGDSDTLYVNSTSMDDSATSMDDSDTLYVVLACEWDKSIKKSKGTLQTNFAFHHKADARKMCDRITTFMKDRMKDIAGKDGLLLSGIDLANLEVNFCVGAIKIKELHLNATKTTVTVGLRGQLVTTVHKQVAPPSVFALVTESTVCDEDACFSGLFATAAAAASHTREAEEYMKRIFHIKPHECAHTIKECPILDALPPVTLHFPFGLPTEDEDDIVEYDEKKYMVSTK